VKESLQSAEEESRKARGTAAAQLMRSMFSDPTIDRSKTAHSLALKSILLVDDDKQLASTLQWILADEDFLVDVAHDGEEAALKVQAHEYDAVVCDMKMPRVRGDEFYLKAREMRPSLSKRFIFITGYPSDQGINEFLNGHDVDYLVKPFPVQRLIKRVKDIVE
jgi:two-component system, NtrC family, nitrogen regulation response regulator NtrX